MQKFTMKADIVFSAENLDDAFNKLSEHFIKLQQMEESDLIEKGQIEIKPKQKGIIK